MARRTAGKVSDGPDSAREAFGGAATPNAQAEGCIPAESPADRTAVPATEREGIPRSFRKGSGEFQQDARFTVCTVACTHAASFVIQALTRQAQLERAEEIELELEFCKKMAAECARNRSKKHFENCKEILEQIVDLATKVGEYRLLTTK